MPLENARFQVISGTKDPPAENPIKLTKIEVSQKKLGNSSVYSSWKFNKGHTLLLSCTL